MISVVNTPESTQAALSTLIAILLATAAAATGLTALVPALPELSTDLGVSYTAIAALQVSIAMPGVLLTPFTGALSEHIGPRRATVGFLLVFGLLGTAGYFTDSFATHLVLRLSMGVSFAAILSLTPTLIGNIYSGARRVRILGLNTVVLTLVSTAAPVAGGLLAARVGIRAPCLLYSAAIPAAFMCAFLLPRLHRDGDRRRNGRVHAFPARSGNRDEYIRLLAAMAMTVIVTGIVVATNSILLPVYLDSAFGLAVEQRGPYVALANIGSAAASVGVITLAKRFQTHAAVVTAQLLAIAGSVGLATGRNLSLVVVAMLLLGAAMGLTYTTMQHAATHLFGGQHTAVTMGLWSSSVRFGQVSGGVAGGAALSLLGLMGSLGLSVGILLTLLAATPPVRRALLGAR